MKNLLTTLFWPILKFFETEEQPDNYKKSHRLVLIVVGSLFILLSIGSAISGIVSNEGIGAFIPVMVFFCLGFVAVIVGTLGSNGAVSKIWGNK